MTAGSKLNSAPYVDRETQRWIVLDPDKNLWIEPSTEDNPGDLRPPFSATTETECNQVPGYYKYTLGLST